MEKAPKCTAHNRAGERCGKYPIRGATVCRNHGGATPQVRAKAAERLAALQDPSVEALARAIDAQARMLDRKGRVRTLGDDHGIQIRAATAVLDRTGLGPTATTNVNVQAGERLASLLDELDTPAESSSIIEIGSVSESQR